MKRAELVFRATLFVCMAAWAVPAFPRQQSATTQTNLKESDIDRLEKELTDPKTRLTAIAALSDFSGVKLYRVGSVYFIDIDAKMGELRERAAELARMYTDADTVSLALDSADPRLQIWGLWFWGAGINKAVESAGRIPQALPMEGLTDGESMWHALMPKVRQLAKDSPYRMLAIDELTNIAWSENREFLLSLIPAEKSASVALQLLELTETKRIGEQSNRDENFNEELLRLLADPDAKVRREALADIALNWNNAEMFQVRFGAMVSQRVEELQKSDDEEEKRLADFAAEGLEKIAKIWLERDSAKTR
ncbi:MAG: hypothetical protein J2P21_07170 [Chloracidobacterium sp.]|nr:hypothetical protein [Chloracidobacterium sp.]